jgi:putative cell wall-binding protein
MQNTPVWLRRLAVGGVSTLAAASGVGFVGLASASATPGFTLSRLAGPDRFATAVAIANQAFPHGAATVLVASGANFPDALSGSYLAGNENGGLGAPILLTNPDSLPSTTQAELATLHATNVIVLGGTDAVSASVATSIAKLGYSVTRVSGPTRFDTAYAADTVTGNDTVGQSGGLNTAILATGLNFPDALGAGALAYHNHFPLMLTDGTSTTLSPQVVSLITKDAIKKVVVVGGSAAVNPAQIAQLKAQFGITVDNPAGSDRGATAEALAIDEITNYGFTDTMFNVANGFDPSFPASNGAPAGFSSDALAGSELSGQEGAPTLITDSPTSGASAIAFATTYASTEASGFVYGGSAAVSDPLVAAIQAAARTAPGPVTVTASPASIAANGSSTSAISVTVLNPNTGTPAANDKVTLTESASVTGACGALTPTSGNTNASGVFTATYTSTLIPGTCTITATDATYGNTSTVIVTQTAPAPPPGAQVLSFTANPTTITANGTDFSVLTAAVTVSGHAQANDPVVFHESPGSTCGTLIDGTPLDAHTMGIKTAANGQAVLTYTAAKLSAGGTCTITATEDDTGATATVAIVQDPTLTVSFSSASVPADGATTSSVNATVTNLGVPVQGLTVKFKTGIGFPVPGACGTLGSATAGTNSSGVATVVYTAGTKIGFCPITVTSPAPAAATVTQYITQTAFPAPATTLSASLTPTTIVTNGTDTVTGLVTVTEGGAGLGSDPILVSASGTPTSFCKGTFPFAVTNITGHATIGPFPAPPTNDSGTCTFTFTEADGGQSQAVVLTVDQPLTAGVTVASIPANGASTTTLTATLLGDGGVPIPGASITFTKGPAFPAGACGTIIGSPTTTNASGVASVTYKASSTVGSCLITVTYGALTDTTTVNQTG